jgi:hypothetical protein
MSILTSIKAPLTVQLYRCFFRVGLLYFSSFLHLLHRGSPLSGILILTGFPSCCLVGLLATFIRIPLSRWILAMLGVLIPGVAFGALFLFQPNNGWVDGVWGVMLWLAIVGVPLSMGWNLFKDKGARGYFS